MLCYLEFSDFRKTFKLGKVSVYALTSMLLLIIIILFAMESPLAHAHRGCTTSTAAICPPMPSWEYEQHQSPERLFFLLLARHRLEAASTGTSTWCSGSNFQFYLCCQKNRQDPKVPWAKLHSEEWIHSSRKGKFSFFFYEDVLLSFFKAAFYKKEDKEGRKWVLFLLEFLKRWI